MGIICLFVVQYSVDKEIITKRNVDASEYKHVVLELTFLKYISDSFEEKYRISRGRGRLRGGAR